MCVCVCGYKRIYVNREALYINTLGYVLPDLDIP